MVVLVVVVGRTLKMGGSLCPKTDLATTLLIPSAPITRSASFTSPLASVTRTLSGDGCDT